MKVRSLRFHGPGDLRSEEVDLRPMEAGDVVIAVEVCGVCGSDLHFLDGSAHTSFVPITLGHEIAGRVVESADPAWEVGDDVVVAAGVSCGSCPACLSDREMICERLAMTGIDFDGGLAEQVVVPGTALLARPEAVPAQVAATAVDAGATAFHAVVCRGRVQPGDGVLIIGAGGLGSYGMQIARARGAAPVIVADRDPVALARARDLQADETILVEEGISIGRAAKLLTGGGVDTAIEFVGRAATLDAAVKSLRPGGTAIAVGVGTEPLTTLPPVLWARHEYALLGSFGSHRRDVEQILEWLADGTLRAPALEEIPLEGAELIIMELASGSRPATGRLMVCP
ncbi:MAG: zinc-binding dehydrogenase [Acidimicrobiia bacterium]